MNEAPARAPKWGVLMAATLLVLAAAVVGIWLLSDPQDESQSTTWNEYRADNSELVVYAMVRRCDHVVGARAEETSERVEVTLRVDSGGVCGDVAVEVEAIVTLSEPLGVRRVYDAVCVNQEGDERQCLRRARD